MTVSPAIQAETQLRLAGKGLPGYREEVLGDLLVRFRIELLDMPTQEECSLDETRRKSGRGSERKACEVAYRWRSATGKTYCQVGSVAAFALGLRQACNLAGLFGWTLREVLIQGFGVDLGHVGPEALAGGPIGKLRRSRHP